MLVFGPILHVILINLVLSGDNAIMISLAVRRLPQAQRRRAIIFGTMAAVGLQIALTLIASVLLLVPGLMLVGGVCLFLVAFSLVREEAAAEAEDEAKHGPHVDVGTTWSAIRRIMLANCIMSLDNVLAVAATSRGEPVALAIGLVVSVSVITVFSSVVARLMNRYRWLPLAGGLMIAFTAGDLIVSDRDLGRLVVSNFNVSLNAEWDERMATRAELGTFAGPDGLPSDTRDRISVDGPTVTFAGVMSERDRDALRECVCSDRDCENVARMYKEAQPRPAPAWAPPVADRWLTERVQVKWPHEMWARVRDDRYPWVSYLVQGGFVIGLLGYVGYLRRAVAHPHEQPPECAGPVPQAQSSPTRGGAPCSNS